MTTHRVKRTHSPGTPKRFSQNRIWHASRIAVLLTLSIGVDITIRRPPRVLQS
jgi:hypothetical protein